MCFADASVGAPATHRHLRDERLTGRRRAVPLILLDSHVLLWAAADSSRLPKSARRLLNDPDTGPWFSAGRIWEIVIKASLGRDDFTVDAGLGRRGLLTLGYSNCPSRVGMPCRWRNCRRGR